MQALRVVVENAPDEEDSSAHQKFAAALQRAQLKGIAQRRQIFVVFLATTEPVTHDDLHRLVKRKDPRIGFTTVYRALKLLTNAAWPANRSP
jgi:Fe2+ or Zn2+ uptake regulation protein